MMGNLSQAEAIERLRKLKGIESVPTVTETVRVTSVAQAQYLLKPDSDWTASDLRDYVMSQIEEFHGPQLRNSVKELAIFKSFRQRYGDKAVAIARFAFEQQRGMWQRAPISVNRFCKASDPYFGDVIAERL